MNKWDDLKQAIKESGKKRGVVEEMPTQPTTTVQPKLKQSSKMFILGLVVIVLSLALVIAATIGENNNTKDQIDINVPAKTNVPVNPPKDDLRLKIGMMDQKLMLLGTAHNNNWHVLQYKLPADDLVYFGADWRFNQFPPHIQFSDRDREKVLSDWVVK